MKRLFGATDGELEDRLQRVEIEAERARILIEESRENVVVVDEALRVLAASRRARETVEGLAVGTALTVELLEGKHGQRPVVVPYELDGRREALVYLGEPGDLAAYEELRAGFTAAVSHELRTPLARLLALL
jgi:signal transduction histidine kinase